MFNNLAQHLEKSPGKFLWLWNMFHSSEICRFMSLRLFVLRTPDLVQLYLPENLIVHLLLMQHS